MEECGLPRDFFIQPHDVDNMRKSLQDRKHKRTGTEAEQVEQLVTESNANVFLYQPQKVEATGGLEPAQKARGPAPPSPNPRTPLPWGGRKGGHPFHSQLAAPGRGREGCVADRCAGLRSIAPFSALVGAQRLQRVRGTGNAAVLAGVDDAVAEGAVLALRGGAHTPYSFLQCWPQPALLYRVPLSLSCAARARAGPVTAGRRRACPKPSSKQRSDKAVPSAAEGVRVIRAAPIISGHEKEGVGFRALGAYAPGGGGGRPRGSRTRI